MLVIRILCDGRIHVRRQKVQLVHAVGADMLIKAGAEGL